MFFYLSNVFKADKIFSKITKLSFFRYLNDIKMGYMEVYVEYVALNNFIIDFLLISSARDIMKLPESKACAFFSAFLGALCTVITPLLKMNSAFTFIVKFFEGALIVLFSGKFPNLRSYIRCFYLFLFITFAFGGAVFGFFGLIGADYDVFLRTPSESGFTIILAIVFFTYFVLRRLISKLYKKKEIHNFVRKCEFCLNGIKYSANGFLDSGNRLKYKGNPVIVVSPELSARLIKNGAFKGLMPRFTSVSTVAGERLLKMYEIREIKIYNDGGWNIVNNVMLGLSECEIKSGGEYDLILGTVFA